MDNEDNQLDDSELCRRTEQHIKEINKKNKKMAKEIYDKYRKYDKFFKAMICL